MPNFSSFIPPHSKHLTQTAKLSVWTRWLILPESLHSQWSEWNSPKGNSGLRWLQEYVQYYLWILYRTVKTCKQQCSSKETMVNEDWICPFLFLSKIWTSGLFLKLLRMDRLNLAPIHHLITRIQPHASCHRESGKMQNSASYHQIIINFFFLFCLTWERGKKSPPW